MVNYLALKDSSSVQEFSNYFFFNESEIGSLRLSVVMKTDQLNSFLNDAKFLNQILFRRNFMCINFRVLISSGKKINLNGYSDFVKYSETDFLGDYSKISLDILSQNLVGEENKSTIIDSIINKMIPSFVGNGFEITGMGYSFVNELPHDCVKEYIDNFTGNKFKDYIKKIKEGDGDYIAMSIKTVERFIWFYLNNNNTELNSNQAFSMLMFQVNKIIIENGVDIIAQLLKNIRSLSSSSDLNGLLRLLVMLQENQKPTPKWKKLLPFYSSCITSVLKLA